MNMFSATGHALSAHDQYERLRRQDRMADYEEQKAARENMQLKMDLDLFKLGLELTARQRDAAQKAAVATQPLERKAAIQMVPSEGGGTRPISPYDRPETSYAQGGEVQPLTPKFDGIYDDALMGKEAPTIFEMLAKDFQDPQYRVGSQLQGTVDHFSGNLLKLAEGGMLPNIYNGVQIMAEGGEVEKPVKKGKKAKGAKAAPKQPRSFTEYIAHYACGGHVKKMADGGKLGERELRERERAMLEVVDMVKRKGINPEHLFEPDNNGAIRSAPPGRNAAPMRQPKPSTEQERWEAATGKKMARGGHVQGPGTGTSDSIPASLDGRQGAVRLSAGEYVLPKKMVDAIGVEKLDAMRKKYI